MTYLLPGVSGAILSRQVRMSEGEKMMQVGPQAGRIRADCAEGMSGVGAAISSGATGNRSVAASFSMRWLVTLACIVLALTAAAQADDWFYPRHPFEKRSPDGLIVALITPARDKAPATITVSRSDDAKMIRLWDATLSNPCCPLEVLVCNDGEHVVTIDNFGGVGYGEDVLAFYSRKGQVRKYGLAQILGHEPEIGSKCPRSISSIWWRQNGITVMERFGDRELLCIWVQWENRWLAWDVASGNPVPDTPAAIRQWDDAARRQVLEWVDNSKETLTAARFLGRLRKPEDRRVLEQLLTSNDFHKSTHMREQSIELFSMASNTRKAADEELAKWDGRPADKDHQYVFLGCVETELRLAKPIQANSLVYIYVIPASATSEHWADSTPSPILLICGDAWTVQGVKGQNYRIRFDGVTPGRYWLKAVHVISSPFISREQTLYLPIAGDYQSTGREVFDVKAGQTTSAPAVECTVEMK